MTILHLLIPVTLAMGVVGLGAFFWSLRSNQYDDLAGDATRILHDEDTPLPAKKETAR
ncbi:cbb3-type cytochrome oxidase assembly protein CcoS [Paracoccus sediminicola]|uniref:cbb3-type cytochrome oxidase assembly protein CcoS n=1 Tax=Paracoccus sediminicola TaxID=3017783 RepID=UPI0022F05B2F|nr:cbb3-type cytochrome oxidase assembly protein CcoS [Paracoccus sediminicola]WBU58718.1 cbb3-type cytochrome oxidase assembly protein CcoS [Paracoccus sediminicola]